MPITLYPMVVQAVWMCVVCKRLKTGIHTGVLWDGNILRGLSCLDHGPDELDEGVRRLQEESRAALAHT